MTAKSEESDRNREGRETEREREGIACNTAPQLNTNPSHVTCVPTISLF